MTRNELIARVAANHIKHELGEEDEHTALRFCIVGMDALASEIAHAVLSDAELAPVVSVRIPQAMADRELLPESAIASEAAAHWRNTPLEAGRRAILFAISNEEMQRIGKTAEMLPKLETDRLRYLYSTWIEAAGLGGDALQDKERAWLEAALAAVNATHVARTLEMFAEYVRDVGELVGGRSGLRVTKALDEALPALHLPRNGGAFDEIPEGKRTQPGEWAKRFRRLHTHVRPLLVRENNKGERIDERIAANLEEVRPELDDGEARAVADFLAADLSPDHWRPAQEALVGCDWERIKGVFEGARRPKLPLGGETIRFFDEEFPDDLDPDDREYLDRSLSPPPRDPTDEAVEFYERHRERIAHKPALHRDWERFIYHNPKTYDDFLVGLVATLHRLREAAVGETFSERPWLHVRIAGETGRRSFWEKKNGLVMRYFAQRHHGLETAFGDRVEFDFGRLADYYLGEVDAELARVTKSGKDARSLKFEVILDPDGANEKTLFHWMMEGAELASALPEDLRRLANLNGPRALLPTADVARQSVSAKGRVQRVSLDNRATLLDVDNANNGALVAPNHPAGDLYERLREALERLVAEGFIDREQQAAVAEALERFAEAYTRAVRAWVDTPEGLAADALGEQAQAYGALLEALRREAQSDICRERLWRLALRVGVANVGGGTHAAVITPWQPLRLAEMHAKMMQAAALVTTVLDSANEDVSRADLFFAQRQSELAANYYPEVCIGLSGERPMLLAVTQSRHGYSLAELPHRSEADAEKALDVDPQAAASAFAGIGEKYLELLPHEKANFSVALYNCDSKMLPKKLADALSGQVEQEEQLRCDLLLTHTDPMRMRKTYEQQNMAVAENGAAALSSEAAKNFLSRLRVGFLDPGEIPRDPAEARAVDLVLLQDVVARNAEVVWKPSPSSREPDLLEHVPPRWSRRRPVGRGETSSAVYLSAPVQPACGQAYLNALARTISVRESSYGDLIPAREISYQDSGVGDVFRETHRIGEWVVNFDELVDRRLLEQQGINVIRHIHDRGAERSLVVSTTSEPRLLKALLDQRLASVDPALEAPAREEAVAALIREANKLSGQVVMRAARFGRYANELMGIVLSMQYIKRLLKGDDDRHIGWFFLDDFASWFGQKEEQIADILALAPCVIEDAPVLRLVVTEAKFVSAQGYQAHRKSSARQLSETIERISRALDPSHARIDREVWLNRIGDLMIEAMEPFDDRPVNGWNLQEWSERVRKDEVPIEIVGYSHVFVHDDSERVAAGDPVALKGLEHCWQLVVDRDGVRKGIREFISAGPVSSMPEPWSEALVSQSAPGERARTEVRDTGASVPADGPSAAGVGADADPRREAAGAEAPSAGQAVPDSAPGVPTEAPGEGAAETPWRPLETPHRWPSAALRDWVEAGSLDSFETPADREWVEAMEKALQRALRGYGMTAELLEGTLTPNAAIVRFKGSDDLTIPKIERKRGELYTSHGINVINVLPEPGRVAVMVGRSRRAELHMRDLWRKRALPDTAPKQNTSLLLGAKEEDGELLYLNLAGPFGEHSQHGPHSLIAGETGSGKGVLVQNLLLDICATNSPHCARIKLIDPKAGVDYPWMRTMPHLDADVITEQADAIATMEALVDEMERRNRLIASENVSKIGQYNAKVAPADRLPLIFLFHDELADWMLIDDYRKAIETNVTRLGMKARAAGIHLFLITQRPDKDALPMQLRANCSNRLILKVADKRNSQIALDEDGAERLLGQGHLAAKLSGEGRIILTQVPFVSEAQAAEIGNIIRNAWQSQ